MTLVAVWNIETHEDADEAPDTSLVLVVDEFDADGDDNDNAELIAADIEDAWALDEGSITAFKWHVIEAEHEYKS